MINLPMDEILWVRPGEGIAVTGHVPTNLELFQDHFPAFPLLPGVLSLEILKRVADEYYLTLEIPTEFTVKEISRAKFSGTIKPGDTWKAELRIHAQHENEVQWQGKLFHREQAVASARLTLGPKRVAAGVAASS